MGRLSRIRDSKLQKSDTSLVTKNSPGYPNGDKAQCVLFLRAGLELVGALQLC